MTPYYQDSSCTLYHATVEVVLPTLPEKSVHRVLVDPPGFAHNAPVFHSLLCKQGFCTQSRIENY